MAQIPEILIPTNTSWTYFKGVTEASSPTNAWRDVAFDDSTWLTAAAPFHYGTNVAGGDDAETGGTILADMKGSYGCVFLRHSFVVTNALLDLKFGFNIDDGLVAWINGQQIQRAYVSANAYSYLNNATTQREANYFFEYSVLSNATSVLRNGTNVLCVQAFNYRSTNDDFRVIAQLVAVHKDATPPVVVSVDPAPGSHLTNLNQVTVTFDESVSGVSASHLLVNGSPSGMVTGSNNVYTYTFNQPAPGPVQFQWAASHSLTDTNGNRLNQTASANRWYYTLADLTPPTIVGRSPAPSSMVAGLSQIQVEFSEVVLGVDAADLWIGGQPATNVAPLGAKGFLFRFPEPGNGVVTISWDPNHHITDTGTPPNPFDHSTWSWSYIVVPKTEPTRPLVANGSDWRYRKGTSEASSPTNLWREPGFDDSSWTVAPAPFHFGTNSVGGDDTLTGGTILTDMRSNYTCIFLRQEFVITDTNGMIDLKLTSRHDDGWVAWINGKFQKSVRTGYPNSIAYNYAVTIPSSEGEASTTSLSLTNLRPGTNLLAVQAFNRPLPDNDFRIDVALIAIYPDFVGPVVTNVIPSPDSTVTNLTQITVTFNERVTGVVAEDFLVNGDPAIAVTGSSNVYTYSINQPAAGRVQITWYANHTLADTNGNRFDEIAPSSEWEYQMVDGTPPRLVRINPAPTAVLGSLTQIAVEFSEPVTGLDAADLRINDQPALSVVPTGPANYLFRFAGASLGTAQVTWSSAHGITDQAGVPNAFIPAAWSYTVDSAAVGNVIINEFSAHWFNDARLADEDGEHNDWIEIYNRGTAPVNLLGWSLTTDVQQPGLWEFPNLTLTNGQYLVVFASGKNRATPGSPVHTNFRLNQFGEYLALYRPGLPPVAASEFAPAFPEQRENISYGLNPTNGYVYYGTNDVTPGGVNKQFPALEGVVSTPGASVKSGFFDRPFSLVLATETPGAIVRYTLDGSSPESGGIQYTGPIPVASTSRKGTIIVRAAAFKSNWLPSLTLTHTYIFPDQVLTQPDDPDGFPTVWVSPGSLNDSIPDYGMDPDIINDTANNYGALARQGLTDIPTISIVTDPDLMWSPSQGFYVRKTYDDDQAGGEALVQPCNVELLSPDGSEPGFNILSGIRIVGGTSPDNGSAGWKSRKLSMRLVFKGEFGQRSLQYPIFPDSPVDRFDTLVLDAGLNNVWSYNGDSGPDDQRRRAEYCRDQYASDLHNAVGGPSPHGRHVHVYLNGLYWGLHGLHERPDHAFAASYFGGEKEDYYAIKHNRNSAINPDPDDGFPTFIADFDQMFTLARSGLANNAVYAQLQQQLDVPAFIDYMIVNGWAANTDWPHQNWYASKHRSPSGRWRFHSWDAEHVLESKTATAPFNDPDASSPGELLNLLKLNAEFRLQFADQMHRHLFNGGVLYVDPSNPVYDPAHPERNRPAALFMKRINGIDPGPLVAESARWGDTAQTGNFTTYVPLTRNGHFRDQLESLLGIRETIAAPHGGVWRFFVERSDFSLTQWRSLQLYPNIAAPVFNQHGGRVAPGFSLFISNSQGAGTVYYTTDDSDPRTYGTGAVSPAARPYAPGTPIVLSATAVVKARLLSGSTWSALNQATFTVGSLGVPLRITEIMYHPPPAGNAGNRYEFIELENVGATMLDLSYYSFDGITFQFPVDYTLNPGARIVLASGLATNDWIARYPGVAVAFWWYDGSLNNGGEKLAIYLGSQRITSVTYSDSGGWPTAADGLGYSLELVNPHGDPNDPANWRASANLKGSPGLANPPPPAPSIVLNEIMATNFTAVAHGTNYPDWIELRNVGAASVNLVGWSLSDSGDPRKFVFPTGVTLGVGEYLVVWCDPTQPASTTAGPDLNTGFGLDRGGEAVLLYDANTNRVDAVSFGPQLADYSIGRIGGNWTLTLPTAGSANQTAPIAGTGSLVINEWLANAPPGGADWIELHNVSSSLPVGLHGIYLGTSNTLCQVLSLSFVAPRGFIQLIADGNPGPDHLSFNLPKEGGAILLYDETGAALDQVIYGPQLESVSEGRLPNGTGGIVDFPVSPSPAASNYVASYTGPYLNEVLAHNESFAVSPFGQYADWVELENPSATPVDLGGMRLSDSPSAPAQWIFPAGTLIEGNGHLVVWGDSSQPASTSASSNLNMGFALSRSSGGVYLFNAQGQRVDAVEYGFQLPDQSIGRISGPWRLLNAPTLGQLNAAPATLGALADVRLNEWLAASTNGPDWFELYNRGTLPVNLEGAYLTDDPSILGVTRFRVGPLSFVGAKDWVLWFADSDPSQGRNHVNFSLDDLGETLRLYSPTVTLLDGVDFGLQTPEVSLGRLPDGATTIETFATTPSPGGANYLPIDSVVINEVLAHTDNPFEDAIELHNPTANPVDVSGWYVSNTERDLKQYRIPAGPAIPAGGFRMFYENQFNPTPGVPPSFALSSARGDQVQLSDADGAGNLTGYRTFVTFGVSENGVSIGRIPTSVGVDFGALSARTFGADDPATVEEFRTGVGASNAAPRVGPVVINEIMYHPISGTGDQVEEDGDEEFIELLNITPNAVDLYDPAHAGNRWKLQDAVSFVFPPGASLASGAYCLVVNFDPVLEPGTLASFRTKYGLDTGVAIYGPWSGRLDNAGEKITLYRPDNPQPTPGPDAGMVPYLLVDKVAYSDRTPWATNAVDGGGASLQRIAAANYGNDPINWRGQAHTAGATNEASALAAPTFVIPPQSQTIIVGEPVMFSVTADGTAPLAYQWLFEGIEISGATATNYSIASVGPTNAGGYSVRVSNAGGTNTSLSATLTVLVRPQIVEVQPARLTVPVGSNVVFTVTATGSEPLEFRWLFNGGELNGATGSSLGVGNAQVADSGGYQAVVTNAAGAVTSAVVTLVVKIPPAFSGQPQNLTVTEGQDAVFNVSATGDSPLTLLWHVDGAPVNGANGSSLTVHAVTAADDGKTYWVVASNDVGAALSAVATLTVLTKPVLVNVVRLPDGALSFSIDGQAGRDYWLEASPDFTTWGSISETPYASGQTVIMNTLTNGPQVFYRARLDR